MKGSGEATVSVIDEHDGGAGWLAYPDESMQRASHALVSDGDVYLIDPLDAPGLDEFLADLGTVAGVLVLLDRHKRDSAAIAGRHDVPVLRPEWMSKIDSSLDAQTEALGSQLRDTGYQVRKRFDTPVWKEAVLYHPDREVLLVPEALGTVEYFRTSDERLGVHPMMRFTPPRELGDFRVEHLLVGHGEGIHGDASAAIRDALDGATRRAPRLYWKALRGALG